MKYLLLLLLSVFSFDVHAEEASSEDGRIMIIRPSEDDDGLVNDEDMPSCNNEQMIKQVHAAVDAYLREHGDGSIISRRKRNLILKYLDKYTEIPVADFDSKTNYLVANELVLTKINRRIKEKYLRLCVSDGKNPLYLLIYPEDFGYRVQIIDFVSPDPDGNKFSVFYVPEVKHYEPFEM